MAYLGIDLGTTNSVAVIYDDKNDHLVTVKVDGVDDILASCVSIREDEIIVGTEAKNGAIIYPEETVSSIKRRMGQEESIIIKGRSYQPEEISSMILKKLKDAASEQWGESFDEVVITHPAYFNDRQVFATKKAGELAGFKQVHLLSEPLASAIEYGFKQGYAQTLLVYDLGGGTFDACVLKVNRDINGKETFQELSDVGDMHLGGDDFDQCLIDYMVGQIELMAGIGITNLQPEIYFRIMQKLKYEAEEVKKKLSSTNKAYVKLHPLWIHEGMPINLALEITKEDFEGMIRSLVEKSRDIVFEALKRADIEADDISKVILVGGSTLVPMVKRMVAGTIKEPYRASDPAKSVAMGASIYNYLIHLPQSKVKVGQITRQHIGTQAIVNRVTLEKELIPIIKMGTSIPATVTDEGFTVTEGASAVRVDVFQWEEGHETERKYIGHLLLEGIDAKTQLAITYTINSDNLFEVAVKDKMTERSVTGAFDRGRSMPELPIKTHSSEGDATGLNIVFAIDTTGSMDTYIDGVKDKAVAFSNILLEKHIDFHLGLIGFGDLLEKERPKIYKWTKDVLKFQKRVHKIPRTCGGDIPESSLDALETCIALINHPKTVKTYKSIVILITDAPPHIPTVSGLSVLDLKKQLETYKITLYIVAKQDKQSLEAYEPLIGEAGHYYSMNDSFHDILDNIAYSLAELVRV